MGQLDNQTAIITGGGTGIGLKIAKRFHDEGAFVVICGRREDVLKEAAADISPDGERVLAVRADIISEEDIRNLVKKTVDQTGRIDILINNAGAMRVNKPPEETSLDEFRFVIDTNVSGTFLVSREVGKVMIEQKSGRIINISSHIRLHRQQIFSRRLLRDFQSSYEHADQDAGHGVGAV